MDTGDNGPRQHEQEVQPPPKSSLLSGMDIDDSLWRERRAHHERIKNSAYFRAMQAFEQQCFTWRTHHPVLFNLGVAHSVLASFVVSSYLRRKTRVPLVSTLLTLGTTLGVYVAYLRSFNAEWRQYYALPILTNNQERRKAREDDSTTETTTTTTTTRGKE